jgi:CubicO group peptidase (beta-lactamase class C family)
MRSRWVFIVCSIILGFSSCEEKKIQSDKFPAREFIKSGEYLGEYYPTNGWRECTPEKVNIDSKKLKEMNGDIAELVELGYNIHTVLIIRKGYIIAEQYFSRYFDQYTEHKIASCTKSFTSALIGIAIEEGYIDGIDAKMVDFFDAYEIANMSQEKSNITLEHMLTMSAGLDWNELDYLYSDPQNTNYQWKRSDDWIQFVLDRPMEYSPGEVQDYNSGLSELLACIVQKTTGIRADSFAVEKLFNPMGITEYYWPLNPQGYARGGGGVRLTPRDMAKLGYLHLQEGMWEEEQLVPVSWISASGVKHIIAQHMPGFYYGYQFWVFESGTIYTALGYGGQWIMIIPDYDMVVVFTNHFVEGIYDQWITPIRLLNEYILPSITDIEQQ